MFPSIDDVAMCMLFDGVFGTPGGSLGRLEVAAGVAWRSEAPDPGRKGLLSDWARARAAVSDLKLGNGGGKGDIEMLVTDAEWAW